MTPREPHDVLAALLREFDEQAPLGDGVGDGLEQVSTSGYDKFADWLLARWPIPLSDTAPRPPSKSLPPRVAAAVNAAMDALACGDSQDEAWDEAVQTYGDDPAPPVPLTPLTGVASPEAPRPREPDVTTRPGAEGEAREAPDWASPLEPAACDETLRAIEVRARDYHGQPGNDVDWLLGLVRSMKLRGEGPWASHPVRPSEEGRDFNRSGIYNADGVREVWRPQDGGTK